jgi:hypothetical protein
VLQDPTTYSVSGLTLTFSTAPPSGTGNISCRYLGIPASGVTTTAYRTVTEFTATASQTTFTPPSYTAGFINVYRNGVRLGSADYTAFNGTTVVLASGATAGDLVTTESYYVSSVLNAIPATAGAVTPAYLSGNAPQVTSYTSGSGTYTTPSNAKAIWVRMVGGGGGGGASSANAGTGGGNSTFGSLTAGGGGFGNHGASIGGAGGGGGTASGGDVNSTGSTGSNGARDTGNPTGGMGGTSVFGGASTGGLLSSAGSNAGGYGSGGGGAGGAVGSLNSGGGGGAGGYVEKTIASPSASYSYSIGSGGAGGIAGSYAGGSGSGGLIIVTAYF